VVKLNAPIISNANNFFIVVSINLLMN
ncbi:MAG: hypothetical protein ACI9V1_002657, partial [Spirosomataceae bacterium]